MRTVDARGLRCPLPVIRLAAAARDAPPGSEILVLWSDPAAEHDIPAWARMRGHEVMSTRPAPETPAPDAPAAQPPASGQTPASSFATTIRLSP